MKDNWINNIHVEGYVFKHDLQERLTGPNSKNPNTPFIMGSISVATDDEAMNIVPVHFTYVTPTYAKSGKENATYAVLKQIMEGDNTFETCGTAATKIRVDGAVETNDFITREGEMASPKRIRASFCHIMTTPIAVKPATFEFDMLIDTAVVREFEDREDYMELKGNVFNFRGDIVPVTISMSNPDGISFFEGQDISVNNPCLVNLWGNIISTTIVQETEKENVAFGAKVNTSTRTFTAWDVEGACEPMEFDSDITITKAELATAVQNRETYLADVRKRHDEYLASKNGQSGFPANSATTTTTTTSPTANVDYGF